MQSFLLFLLSVIDVCIVWKWLVLFRSRARLELELSDYRDKAAADQRRLRELEFRNNCQAALLRGESVLKTACRYLKAPNASEGDVHPLALQVTFLPRDGIQRECLGLTADQESQLRINVPALRSWEHSRLTNADLREGEPVRLPASALAGLHSLHLLRFKGESGDDVALLLSRLPMITGESRYDQSLFLEVLTKRSPETSSDHRSGIDEEIRLVKEMLELRTLTDIEFQSPLEMLSEFLSKLCQFCNFERGALYLNRVEQDQLKSELTAQGGKNCERCQFEKWVMSEQRLVERHLTRRDVVYLDRETAAGSESPPFHSGLLLPLIHGKELLGQLVLTGYRINRPTEADLQLASWGADYLINTMIKTANRVKTEDQARRDPLTQLANRQAFDDVLKRSIRHSLETDTEPCSLILLDLDHFKMVNDTYGHLAGDAVLKHAAQVVHSVSHSRVTDQPLVARYGGEEIAVLLPNVGEAGATRIAEAIRDTLCSSPLIYNGHEIHVTTSGGLAVCPMHASSADQLLAAADSALYRAKRLGRNRIEVASGAVSVVTTGESPAA